MASVRTRPAKRADIVQLADLKRSVEDEVYSGLGTPKEHATGLAEFASETYIAGLLDEADVCVAVDDGDEGTRLVGMAAVGPPLDGRTAPLLQAVYIRPPWRGCGLGRLLVACLLSPATRLEQAGSVEAETYSSNPGAQAWLRSLDFHPVGQARPSETYAGERLDLFSASVADLRRLLSGHLSGQEHEV